MNEIRMGASMMAGMFYQSDSDYSKVNTRCLRPKDFTDLADIPLGNFAEATVYWPEKVAGLVNKPAWFFLAN